MKATDVILLQSDAFAKLRGALMYRGADIQGVDAGYDSDVSLEAFNLSEGPNTEGANSGTSCIDAADFLLFICGAPVRDAVR